MTLEQRAERAERRVPYFRDLAVVHFDKALGYANLGMGKEAVRERKSAELNEQNAKVWAASAKELRGELAEGVAE